MFSRLNIFNIPSSSSRAWLATQYNTSHVKFQKKILEPDTQDLALTAGKEKSKEKETKGRIKVNDRQILKREKKQPTYRARVHQSHRG